MRRAFGGKLSAAMICAISLAALAGRLATSEELRTDGATTSDAAAEVLQPDLYRHVEEVTWVVGDLDRVVGYWQQLGIREIRRDGVVSYPNLTYRGKPDPATVKQVTAQFGQTRIKWIQPLHGGRYWSEELKAHGDGIRVLSYAVHTPAELDNQVKYFASREVGVAVENNWKPRAGSERARMVYLDTAAQGGGTMMGLIYDPDAKANDIAATNEENEYPFKQLGHFAWVVNDVRRVDAYYTSLGFKPFSGVDHNISLDRVYRGQPGIFEMWLGWNRTGDAPFEWVQQITGPDIYVEYMKKHGEGFHHLGVNVTDMDEAIKQFSARGAPPSQLAAWSTPKGKGRAVYVDTEPWGGVTLELIYDPH